MEKAINAYTKGMNQDLSTRKEQKETYYSATNIRLITQDGSSTIAIENVKGTQKLVDLTNGADIIIPKFLLISGWSIVGQTNIKNDIVLFLKNKNNHNCVIALVPYDETNKTYREMFYIVSTSGFDNKVKALGIYETEYVRKVYWIDKINDLRYANIAPDVDSTTGLVKSGLVEADYTERQLVSDNKTYINQKINIVSPVFDKYTQGSLYEGNYGYCVRFYNYNGNQSIISPMSYLIPISNTNLTNIELLRGAKVNTETDKGISIKITIPMDNVFFDAIEVISLRYFTLNTPPQIRVIGSVDIKQGSVGTFTFVDTGQTIGNTVLYSDVLSNVTSYNFKSIRVKDNILFGGSTSETIFDIGTYDARAYRFKSDSTWYINGVTAADYTNVPIDNDCINPFNTLSNDYDSTYEYKYHSWGALLGGEGTNIEYTFKLEPYVIATIDLSATSPSITNLSIDEYVLGQLRGFSRDEIYRFGIVFFNERGQSSFVNWIGDIRMPRVNDLINGKFALTSILDGAIIYGNALYPVFTVKSLPTGAVGFQIVYVQREAKDRTVLGQGLIQGTIDDGGNYKSYSDVSGRSVATYGGASSKVLIDFISPEVNVNKNLQWGDGDLLYVDELLTFGQEIGYSGSNLGQFAGHRYNAHPTNIVKKVNWSEIVGTSVNTIVDNYQVDNKENANAYDGTKVFAVIDNTIATTGMLNTDFMTARYRRPTVQYNGNTYNDRFNNIYIPASLPNDYTVTLAGMEIECKKGDTFVGLYDFLEVYPKDLLTGGIYRFMFPVETSINCQLMELNVYGTYKENRTLSTYIKETGNSKLNGIDTGWGDLYTYNTVYSQVDNSKFYIPKPKHYQPIIRDVTAIRYSLPKTSGEERDSFLQFLATNVGHVESKHGEIQQLVNFMNDLYCFQTDGFCLLPVNERQYETTNVGTTISIGSGAVLGNVYNYRIGSTEIGIQNDSDIIQTLEALYWMDSYKRKIYKFANTRSMGFASGSSKAISDMEGLSGYLKTNVNNFTRCIGVYDNEAAEIVFTFEGKTITYNELLNCFVSFYNINPSIYIKTPIGIFTENSGLLYQHNRGNFNKWYETYYDSFVTILINPHPEIEKQFTNVNFDTEVTQSGIDQKYMTISSIQATNDYEDSGVLYVIGFNSSVHDDVYTGGLATDNATVVSAGLATARRRNRLWRTVFPRLTNNTSNDYRFRDKYAKLTMKFSHNISDDNNYRFVLHDVITNYNVLNYE